MRSAGVILSLVAAAMAVSLPHFHHTNPSSNETVLSTEALPLGEIGWEGKITPDGPKVEVWGSSFEEIEAKIKKDHPDFSIYLDEVNDVEVSPAPEIVARKALEARNHYNCVNRFGQAHPGDIETGVNNLRRINGNSCKARARTCIRTQCNGYSAIGLCNDNYYDIDVGCTDVANMAEHIRRNCWDTFYTCFPYVGCWVAAHWTFGQKFSPGHTWNVIVGQCVDFGNGERPVKA